jgi:hypothetical protein
MSPAYSALASIAILVGANLSHAAPIPGLFNTGVDGSGAPLAGGSVDPHYFLIASADPSYPGPDAIVADPIATGFWVANSATSKWIAPTAAQGYPSGGTPHPGGPYTFRLRFDLTGCAPNTASISGRWAADNSGTIHLNGAATGNVAGGYNPLVPFSITSGFVSRINHLDFVVTNFPSPGENPIGLRVEDITGTVSCEVPALEATWGSMKVRYR